MLSLQKVDVDIGPVPVLRQVDLEVAPGQVCGLIGRNGAGKTTCLRAIMGLLRAKAGRIAFADTDLIAIKSHERAALGIGYMPEDRRLVPELTAEENILLPIWSTGQGDYRERLDWIYGLMPELAEFRARGAPQLSGGQQKLVALARAVLIGRRLLLLDEPSEGIAPVLARRMGEVLRQLKEAGESVLIVESNDHHLGTLLERRYVIERGSVSPQ